MRAQLFGLLSEVAFRGMERRSRRVTRKTGQASDGHASAPLFNEQTGRAGTESSNGADILGNITTCKSQDASSSLQASESGWKRMFLFCDLYLS